MSDFYCVFKLRSHVWLLKTTPCSLAIMSVSSGGSASVMEAVRQSLTAVPADAAAESNQRSLGNFGVLVVNQGGKNKSEERNNAKRTDLRTHFVQLVFLQEHDPLLLAGREWDGTEWLEVALPSGLACRGRKSAVEQIQLLSDIQLDHEKSSVSGIATFEIVWRPELDRRPLRVTNVHFHHKPAKKQSGFKQAFKAFWDKLAGDMLQYDSVLLVGDFNQSLKLTEADQKVLRPPRLPKLIRAFAFAFSSSRVRLRHFYVTSAQLWHGY